MAQWIFINQEYINRWSHFNGSVDMAFLEPSLVTAQEKHIKLYLGSALYDAIVVILEAGTIDDAGNAAYKTLLNDYVARALLHWTLVEVMPYMRAKIDNGSITTHQGENTAPLTQPEYQGLLTKETSNAQTFTQRLVTYLCNNTATLPEYLERPVGGICPSTDVWADSIFEIG